MANGDDNEGKSTADLYRETAENYRKAARNWRIVRYMLFAAVALGIAQELDKKKR